MTASCAGCGRTLKPGEAALKSFPGGWRCVPACSAPSPHAHRYRFGPAGSPGLYTGVCTICGAVQEVPRDEEEQAQRRRSPWSKRTTT